MLQYEVGYCTLQITFTILKFRNYFKLLYVIKDLYLDPAVAWGWSNLVAPIEGKNPVLNI